MKPFLIFLALLSFATLGTVCFFAVPATTGLLILSAAGCVFFLALAILAAIAERGRKGE